VRIAYSYVRAVEVMEVGRQTFFFFYSRDLCIYVQQDVKHLSSTNICLLSTGNISAKTHVSAALVLGKLSFTVVAFKSPWWKQSKRSNAIGTKCPVRLFTWLGICSSPLHPQSTPQYFNRRHRCFLPRFLFKETRQSGMGLVNVDNQPPCGSLRTSCNSCTKTIRKHLLLSQMLISCRNNILPFFIIRNLVVWTHEGPITDGSNRVQTFK